MSFPVERRNHILESRPSLLGFRYRMLLHTAPRLRTCTCHCDFLLWPRRDSNSHIFRYYHLKVACIPFHHLAILWSWSESNRQCLTSWVSDFKSDAFLPFSPQDQFKTKNPNFFSDVRVCLILDILLHHEINPNLAQPEPAVLIHNVLFTTIVRFKFVIFRFIVIIISYILKSFCLFCYFIQIYGGFFTPPNFCFFFKLSVEIWIVFIVLQIYK